MATAGTHTKHVPDVFCVSGLTVISSLTSKTGDTFVFYFHRACFVEVRVLPLLPRLSRVHVYARNVLVPEAVVYNAIDSLYACRGLNMLTNHFSYTKGFFFSGLIGERYFLYTIVDVYYA